MSIQHSARIVKCILKYFPAFSRPAAAALCRRISSQVPEGPVESSPAAASWTGPISSQALEGPVESSLVAACWIGRISSQVREGPVESSLVVASWIGRISSQVPEGPVESSPGRAQRCPGKRARMGLRPGGALRTRFMPLKWIHAIALRRWVAPFQLPPRRTIMAHHVSLRPHASRRGCTHPAIHRRRLDDLGHEEASFVEEGHGA